MRLYFGNKLFYNSGVAQLLYAAKPSSHLDVFALR